MGIAVPATVLVLWELCARLAIVSPRDFPPPTTVGGAPVARLLAGGPVHGSAGHVDAARLRLRAGRRPRGPPRTSHGHGAAGARPRRALHRVHLARPEDRLAPVPADHPTCRRP